MSQPPDQPADPYGTNPPPNYGAPPPPPPPPGWGQPDGEPGDQGGYGALPPPPPPPGPGYGGQPGGPGPVPFSIGDAVSWAWNKFTQNPAPLVVPALIYMIVNQLLGGVQYAASPMGTTTVYDRNTGSYSVHAGLGTTALLISSIVSLLYAAVAFYQHASYVSGTLDIADGKPVEIATFFKPRNLGPVILTALLVGVGVMIGLFLCIVPGVIFAVLAMFSIQYVIDRSLSPIDAIKASIATVRANVRPALLCVLVLLAAGAANAITCGLAWVVTIPISALVLTYTYRTLTGGQVVEAVQPGYPQGPPPYS